MPEEPSAPEGRQGRKGQGLEREAGRPRAVPEGLLVRREPQEP